jgi:periplasmic divalent cation tolerance protein
MIATAESIRVLVMTCPPADAERLVQTLLEQRLIACGNVVPGVLSRYWWQGAVCSDGEALVVMETAADRVGAAIRRLAEIHPYEVPKILAFAPETGLAAYLEWVHASTRPAS